MSERIFGPGRALVEHLGQAPGCGKTRDPSERIELMTVYTMH
jgi:hypothetical protein